MNSHAVGAPDMGFIFPCPPSNVFYQLPPAELIEQALKRNEALLADSGVLAAGTTEMAAATPNVRLIAEDEITSDAFWWNGTNRRLTADKFDALQQKLTAFLGGRDIFVRDGCACANEKYHIDIRIITETACQNLFAAHLFLPPATLNPAAAPEWTIISAPGFTAEDGTDSKNFTAISFSKQIILIGGSCCCGEIKNSIFTLLNFILPAKNVLPMHCAANAGTDGGTALFFGLSGSGKTALSASPERLLIGDDEHGWSDYTIFGIEGSCYTPSDALQAENNPLINGANCFGILAEHTAFYPGSRKLNYADAGKAQAARITVPLSAFKNAASPSFGLSPRHIFFLTADVYGVIPPVARLTAEQAVYYFLSGYSGNIKKGSDEVAGEQEALFSACFGEDLMPLHPIRYAALFEKKIKEQQPDIWLINTGRLGSGGKRIPLRHTRAIISAILNNELHDVHLVPHQVFHTGIPVACPGVPDKLLDPVHSWNTAEAYEEACGRLATLFHANFEQYAGLCAPEITEAGPRLTVSA